MFVITIRHPNITNFRFSASAILYFWELIQKEISLVSNSAFKYIK